MVKRPGTNTWGTVCHDAFDFVRNPETYQEIGNVACRSLGFTRMVEQKSNSVAGITGKIKVNNPVLYLRQIIQYPVI